MLINNKSIDEYNCCLLHRNISPVTVVTYNDWLDGAIQPTFIRQQDSFKQVEVELLMEASSEQDAQYLLSNLTKAAKRCKVKFDEDMDELTYNCVLDTIETERIKKSVFSVKINWKSGYAACRRVELNPDISGGQFQVKSKGTAPAACIFELIPIASTIVEVNVGGLTDTGFTIRNVPNGSKLVIDSYNGEINLVNLETGEKTPAIDCYDNCWELPKILPGLNTITLDYTTGYNIKLSYEPTYL